MVRTEGDRLHDGNITGIKNIAAERNHGPCNKTFALPVIRYDTGKINGQKVEIEVTVIRISSFLSIHWGFHPKYSTFRQQGNGKRETEDS